MTCSFDFGANGILVDLVVSEGDAVEDIFEVRQFHVEFAIVRVFEVNLFLEFRSPQ